jgi:hypothetical protein
MMASTFMATFTTIRSIGRIPQRLGTSVRQPCGADEHNYAAQMGERGIENNNR